MRRLFFSSLCALAVARFACGAPANFYVNDGIVTNAPVVDALNFVNNNYFNIFTTLPYRTSDTINFTNRGFMAGSPGFDFETFPASVGQAHRAGTFYNKVTGTNGGIINCSGAFAFIITPFLLGGNLLGSSELIVDATNIINSGSINMDASSLIRLRGRDIDLTRGGLTMVDTFTLFAAAFTFNAGILDGYWGIGTTNETGPMNPSQFNSPQVVTPAHAVTFRSGAFDPFHFLITSPNTVAYVNDTTDLATSNRVVQAVFLDNTNSAFANYVFFDPSEIAVQWQWTNSDAASGLQSTNYLVLTDDFGETTNLQLVINGFVGARPTYIPINYSFFSGFDFRLFATP